MNRLNISLALWLSVLALGIPGCAAADADAHHDDDATGTEDLTTRSLAKLRFDLWQDEDEASATNMLCPFTAGWTVDFARARIDGKACDEYGEHTVRRSLTSAEIARLETALEAIRIVRRDGMSCRGGDAFATLDVTRKSGKVTSYVEAHAACLSAPEVRAVTGTTRLENALVAITEAR
jgi:hypothetical protein